MRPLQPSHQGLHPWDIAGRMRIAGGAGFGVALLVALLLHGLMITLLVAGFRHHAKPQIEWIELMPEGVLLGASGTPAAPTVAAQAPSPPMVQPEPARPEPVPVSAQVEPVPERAPKQEALRIPKPEPVIPDTLVAKRPAKKRETINVKLDEVTRHVAPKSPKAVAMPTSSAEPALDAGAVRDQLQKGLGKMGVTGASGDGVSGIPGGTGSGEIATYYALIRDVYYQAWHQPVIPGRERLNAVVRVKIAKDGKVLNAVIERGSGDAAMDETVNAAAMTVKEIGRPLPEGLGSQSAEVTITFEF